MRQKDEAVFLPYPGCRFTSGSGDLETSNLFGRIFDGVREGTTEVLFIFGTPSIPAFSLVVVILSRASNCDVFLLGHERSFPCHPRISFGSRSVRCFCAVWVAFLPGFKLAEALTPSQPRLGLAKDRNKPR